MAYDKESFLRGLALGLAVWMPPDERTINGVSLSRSNISEPEEEEAEDEDAV